MRAFAPALVVALLAARAAGAVEYPVPEDCVASPETEEARRLVAGYWFEQGRAQVDRDAFDEAVRSFACSYSILPLGATLYNLGRAAEWAGDYEVALRALREYLETEPDAPNRADVEEVVVRIAGAAAAGTPPPVPDPRFPRLAPLPPPPPPPQPEGVDVQRLFGWIAVGLAGAGGAAGLVCGSLAAYEQAEIDDAAEGTPYREIADRERKRDDALLGVEIALPIAAAAAVAGTLLLLLGGEEAPDVGVAPAATEDAAALVVVGRF
jgi:tetratricopeptide (TPR) repeat protein